MKIKLVNEQSRKRIEQLNSRLKILTSDIHGEDKVKHSNIQQLESVFNGLKKKNYFRSATHLNTHHNLVNSNIQNNDYELQNHPMLPTSPKFSTSGQNKPKFSQQSVSPQSKYSSMVRSQIGSVKDEIKARKQLKEIIQSKKEFHSLIKKELSELQKLQQMIIEQPQNWDEEGFENEKTKDFKEIREVKELQKKRNERESQRRKEMIKYKQGEDEGQEEEEIRQKDIIIPVKEGEQLMKTKTQQSMQQSMSKPTQIIPFPSNLPTISHPQSANHSVKSSQQFLINQQLNYSSHNSNTVLNQPPSLRRLKAEELLREMMVIDYSEENIQSVLKLVEEESERRSRGESGDKSVENSMINQDNPSIISCNSRNSSISSKNNSSLISMVNSRPFHDLIKQPPNQQEEQQKHKQLIHSYKLLSFLIKIKNFSKLKVSLSSNLEQNNKIHQAITFYHQNLQAKSFNSLKTHTQQSLMEQHLLYKIKTIYTQNMLKKAALKQMAFNSKYKTFKFLSAKLTYQQELKTKSFALNQLLSVKQQNSQYSEVSKLSEQINKKSLFKIIKERYEKIRETYQKYKLLKNVRKHRGWNNLFNSMRFSWVRKIIHSKDQLMEQPDNEEEINIDSRKEPSSSINQRILSQLNNYSQFINSHLSQISNNQIPSIIQQSSCKNYPTNPLLLSHQTIIQFNQSIVLHVKTSVINNYLAFNRKKFLFHQFIEGYQLIRKQNQQVALVQEKERNVIKNIIKMNRKHQFFNNLKQNLFTSLLNKKVSYFCNITIGSVPSSIKHQNSEDHSSENPPIKNSLIIKYFKHNFIQTFKNFTLQSNKQKLQKEIYYETIYGGNLVKRLFYGWKSSVMQMKNERQAQLRLREQIEKQQERLEKEKQQRSIAYNSIKQQQLKLIEQENHLHHKQILLRQKMNKLKEQEESLNNIQKQKREQFLKQTQIQRQLLAKQENQICLRLKRLREEEQLREQRLREIEKEIEERKIREIKEKKIKEDEELQRRNYLQLNGKVVEKKINPYSRENEKLNYSQEKIENKEYLQSDHNQSYHGEDSLYQVEESSNSYSNDNSQSLLNKQEKNQINMKGDNLQQEQNYHEEGQVHSDGKKYYDGKEQKELYNKSSEHQQQYDRQSEGINEVQNYKNQSQSYHHLSDEQESQPDSQNSDKILTQYFSQKPPTQQQNSYCSQKGSSENQSSRLQSQHEYPVKMYEMMDWLGNKIGIDQSLKQEDQKDGNQQHTYQVEQSHVSEQEDNSVFNHKLSPPLQQLEAKSPSGKLSLKQSSASQELAEQSDHESQPCSQAFSQQSQSQSSHSQLASSNSPSQLRLLSYAQNHHNLSIKRLIFNHVFKFQSYKKQQTYQITLLQTVFTSWKKFYQQKKSLKKYLQVYQTIEHRINNPSTFEGQKQRKKREPKSLERTKNNQSVQRYRSGEKIRCIGAPSIKNANPIPQKALYYPTSKQQKEQFQNLFKNQ